MHAIRHGAIAIVCFSVLAAPAAAINIVLDYTHDNFFVLNPTAQATLERAADDISDAITSTLLAVNQDTFAASVGTPGVNQVTADADWSYAYENPSSGTEITINTATIPFNEVRIFVGGRNITSGNTLGVGGPAGMGFLVGTQFFPPLNTANLQAALNQTAAESDAAYRRGGAGPVLGQFNSLSLGGTNYDYNAGYTAAYGNLWFDLDENNDGFQDSTSSLNNYWHWDYNTSPAGKNDLYTVALHEILHAIGFGASDTWSELSSGSTWNGDSVRDLMGSGTNLVNGGHIAQSANSYRPSDGVSQKPVMVPNLTVGQRRMLTALDLAFLQDLGFDTIPIEPPSLAGDYNDDGVVDAADYTVWRDTLGDVGSGLAADGSGNDVIDAADYDVWRENFGRTNAAITATSVAVPEPAAMSLLVIAAGGAVFLRRSFS